MISSVDLYIIGCLQSLIFQAWSIFLLSIYYFYLGVSNVYILYAYVYIKKRLVPKV